MEQKKVGSRGTLFTFDDLGIPTNVYVINGMHQVYLIDTYLGPDTMKPINSYIEDVYGSKPIIVINSHNHWDHVWGNCLYTASPIVAHEKCREYMQKSGAEALEKFGDYKKGDVVLTYPNRTFTDKISFEEDDILVYYTPGHTDDAISILDMKDKVLYAGDNLERPIPFIMCKDLDQYVNTLQGYLSVDADIIIGGHTGCEDKKLVESNLDYIKKVRAGEAIEPESEDYEGYHKTNMNWLSKNQ